MRRGWAAVAIVAFGCGGSGGAGGSLDGGVAQDGATPDGGGPGQDGGAGADAAPDGAAASVTFYVAPNGRDTWSGRLDAPNAAQTDGPFATFEGARAHVQALDKTGLSGVTVQFRAGTYTLSSAQSLTPVDSGTATMPIVYENYPGEAPVLSGGVQVTGWTSAGGNVWKATLPASTIDFENLYYNGERRLRPRLGAYLGTYQRILSSVTSPDCAGQTGAGSNLCLDRFTYTGTDFDGADGWTNLTPAPGITGCTQPGTSKAPVGDVELVVFENYLVAKLRIACVDTTKKIVYLTGPTSFDPYHADGFGFIPNHRVLVENVQSELTKPGQWYLDRSTPGAWTITYLAKPGETPATDTVIIPQSPQVLVASGLSYVTFKGLTFSHDNYVVGDTGYNGAAQVPPAVSFQNSQYITFDSNIVTATAAAGLDFITCVSKATGDPWCAFPLPTGGQVANHHNVVQNGAFYDIGGYAIRLGSSGQKTDTKDNVASFDVVENDVVSGYGRVFPGAAGVLQGQGHDNLITHNEIFDGYKGAVRIHYGGETSETGVMPDDNTISFNHVHDLFQGIVNDGGSLYIGAGSHTSPAGPPISGVGNKILNNVVHDVNDASVMDPDGYNGDGLYVDEYTGQVDLENNLVYRVTGNAVTFSGPRTGPGQGSTVKNNVFAYARNSMINANGPYVFNTQPPSPLFFTATLNIFYFDRNASSTTPGVYPTPSTTQVPAPFYVQGNSTFSGTGAGNYSLFQVWNQNVYFNTKDDFAGDNVAFHQQVAQGDGFNKWTKYTFAQWQTAESEDLQSAVKDPLFKSPGAPKDDYTLPNGAPLPGFVVFDPKQAGRTNAVIAPPKVPPGFPTQTFDRTTDF